MTTTMGTLVASLFTQYERELHDERLAAIATQVRLTELLGSARHGRGPGRTRRR